MLCQIQCDFTGAEINTFECVYINYSKYFLVNRILKIISNI